MTLNQKEIGKRIAKIRKEYNLTQEEFAKILNISYSHLGKLEIGTHGISIDLVVEISLYFNISTDYILLGKSNRSLEIKNNIKSIIGQLSAIEKNL